MTLFIPTTINFLMYINDWGSFAPVRFKRFPLSVNYITGFRLESLEDLLMLRRIKDLTRLSVVFSGLFLFETGVSHDKEKLRWSFGQGTKRF
ncbi:hypothetical protein LCL85_15585 [Vibrio alginolyticus]|nr:hypothetical protein [Vibrio alginolyticus]